MLVSSRHDHSGILYCDKQAGGVHGFKLSAAFSLAQALTLPVILVAHLSCSEDVRQLYAAG